MLFEHEPAWPQQLFANILSVAEHITYVVIGALLSLATAMALAGASLLLWQGMHDWNGTRTIFEIVDRLLIILMLVEILHTVSASVRSGGLAAEPFLIIGLIASIRRVLVITLQTSENMSGHAWTQEIQQQFHASTIELSVLGILILVMVVAIYILRKVPTGTGDSQLKYYTAINGAMRAKHSTAGQDR
jgi:phosphate starvation-inducible membrane PsiE